MSDLPNIDADLEDADWLHEPEEEYRVTSVPVPMCYGCIHLHDDPNMTCFAFPEGIPEAIYLSRYDHRMPYAGDHGIVFVQDPDRPEPDWEIFAEIPTTLVSLVEGLARALAALDDEKTLVLSRRPGVSEDGSNRFVQFAGFGSGSGLRAESVGDLYLEARDELTAEQRTRLAELGWLPPDEGGNYWRQWTEPLPYRDVAAMALQTLREVHGVEHGEQLDFNASAEILRAFGLSLTDEEIGASPDAPTTRPGSGARHLAYWDYDPDARLECPACHWSGEAGRNQEIFKDVLDVRCGSCDTMLLVVALPSLAETREAAAAGNPRAQAELADIEEQAAGRKRAASTLLTDPMQLPDLPGAAIIIDWCLEGVGDESWQVLRHNGVEIWRETAFYESYERFGEVFEILRRRYGDRLQEVRPTQDSGWWLYGDRLGSPAVVDALNRSLRQPPPP